MSDLRLITVEESGEISFTPNRMHVPLTEMEEAIQRLILCLLNTAGTMIDAPGWGGSGKKLYLSLRKASINATKKQAGEVIHQTQLSLQKTERPGPFRIVNVTMRDLIRGERGYNIILKVDFEQALSKIISMPSEMNVVS